MTFSSDGLMALSLESVAKSDEKKLDPKVY
jgi:hypothetical protein